MGRTKKTRKPADRPSFVSITYKGMLWETLVGNGYYSWRSFAPMSFRTFDVFDINGIVSTTGSNTKLGPWHLPSLFQAFDVCFVMAHRERLLWTLQKRATWRVQELERRFGDKI